MGRVVAAFPTRSHRLEVVSAKLRPAQAATGAIGLAVQARIYAVVGPAQVWVLVTTTRPAAYELRSVHDTLSKYLQEANSVYRPNLVSTASKNEATDDKNE